jgi:nucleotide-binding universal stress UspA family protein
MNHTATPLLDRPAPQAEACPTPPEYQDELLIAADGRAPKPPEPEHELVERKGRPRERAIRRILVPTDFSAASRKVVEHAVAIANQCNAALTILHVIDINAQAAPQRFGSAQDLMNHLWTEGSARMGQLAWSLCGQVEAQTSVQEGLPWEEIVERSRDFDLILLSGSRGRKRWNLFSKQTARRVIENAACPVMVVGDED